MTDSPQASTDDRRFPARPILGVGALIFAGPNILLIQRGKPPQQGIWSLPGGAVETGERIEAALLREVEEETGLTVEIVRLAEIFERIIPDENGSTEYHYVLIDYVCRAVSGELRAGSDTAAAIWRDVSDLHTLPLTEGTLEVVLRAFTLHANR